MDVLGFTRTGPASVGFEKDGTLVVLFDDIARNSVALGLNGVNRPNDLWEHAKKPDNFILSGAAPLNLLLV